MSDNPERTLAWDALLTRLEADLARASEHGHRDARPWSVPQDLGLLPDQFIERAKRIVVVQKRVIDTLNDERISVAQHLAALRAVPRPSGNGQSAFLDVTG